MESVARRLPRAALIAAAGASLFGASSHLAQSVVPTEPADPQGRYEEEIDVRAPPLLVRFSFDADDERVTGPDTIAVFEHAKGRVRLSRELVRSGWRSLHLRDVAGDGDFPELQAFFPERRKGTLTLSFALLVVDPSEELNVALAGPAGFGLGRDGIALWLATRDGYLTHVSDSIPRRVAPLRPFVWYEIEAVYSIASGTYSLRVVEEGREAPIATLERQLNASSQPGSAVRLISFIGDNGDDLSNVSFFVDDVQLASDPAVAAKAFVAPGRRKLFVELIEGYGRPLGAAPSCPQPLELADLGLERSAEKTSVAAVLAAALGGAPKPAAGGAPRARDLEAARRWSEGCSALARSDFGAAAAAFRAAVEQSEGAFVYRLSLATALLGAGRLDAAEAIVGELGAARADDPRVATLRARLAAARGFVGEAEEWLRRAVADADSAHELEEVAAGAFHWLMRERRLAEAEAFAKTMEERHAAESEAVARARWIELRGDAAFATGVAGDRSATRRAVELYRTARELDTARSSALDLKLADVAFTLGDLDTERRLRERIYGALLEE